MFKILQKQIGDGDVEMLLFSIQSLIYNENHFEMALCFVLQTSDDTKGRSSRRFVSFI